MKTSQATIRRHAGPTKPCAVCARFIPANRLMCWRHWFMVPADLRGKIWELYRRRDHPTAAYYEAVEQAIAAVCEQEGS